MRLKLLGMMTLAGAMTACAQFVVPGGSGGVGPAGPAGANGTNAYVTVSNVVTLAYGASAYVSNTVAGSTNYLTFGIPAGATGTVDYAVVTGIVTGIVAPYTNHAARTDNPHVTTLQQAVDAGGTATNVGSLAMGTNTLLNLGGFLAWAAAFQGGPGTFGWFPDQYSFRLQYGQSNANAYLDLSSHGVDGLPDINIRRNSTHHWVYATLTNLEAQVAGKLDTNGSGANLTGITPAQIGAVSNTAAGIAAAGGLTNSSFTINDVPVGNGSNITVAASGGGEINAPGVTPFTLTSATNVAIARLVGTNSYVLVMTTNVTLTITTNGWTAAEVGRFSVDVSAGAFTLAFDQAVMTNTTVLDISTTRSTPLYFRKPAGENIWRVRQ
jgi:hypothetical protein